MISAFFKGIRIGFEALFFLGGVAVSGICLLVAGAIIVRLLDHALSDK